MNTRRRPSRSPSDPPTSSSDPSVSRYASTIHCWAASPVSRSSRIAGSATFTTVPSRNTTAEPRTAETSAQRLIRSVIGIPAGSHAVASVWRRAAHCPHGARGRRGGVHASARDRGGQRLQALQASAPALLDVQGARAAPVQVGQLRAAAGGRRRRHRDRRRRVLRDRRPQRLGQEHAAQVPRRDLRDDQRRGDGARARIAVHRARRRLQHGPHRARQRDHQRDHARPHAAPGVRALRRRSSRSPSSRTSSTSSSRTTRRAWRSGWRSRRRAGRRRDHPRRRGAGRRRRLVPAQVLREVRHAQARRQDDRVRHARHDRGRAVLRPRDAARARPHPRARRPRTRSRARTTRSTSGACPRGMWIRTGAAEIRAAWFETADGARVVEVAPSEPLRCAWRSCFHEEIDAAARSTSTCATTSHHTVFATSTDLHELDTGAYVPGDTVVVRARMDNWLVPGRYFLSPTLAALRRRRVRGARRAHEPQHRDGRGQARLRRHGRHPAHDRHRAPP